MPIYPNPAGGEMTVANRADAIAKGWTPSMGTFGSRSAETAASGGGGGGGGGGNPDLAGYIAAMQASSGFSIKQLEENKRQFDVSLEWQKQQWREQGLPELAIKQRAQDLEDKKFDELHRQAIFSEALQTRQQDLDEKVKMGQLSIAQAQQQLAQEIQTGQLRVSQGQLGLDTLKTAASLSGPENWIQAANFNRGVAANSTLPGFVSDLLSGRSTATMAGPAVGAQMSQPLTLQGMAGQMGAGAPQVVPQQGGVSHADVGQAFLSGLATPTPGVQTGGAPLMPTPDQRASSTDVSRAFGRPTDQQNQVDASTEAMRRLYGQGGQAYGPQALEGLTATERKMMEGGGAAIGADVAGFNEAYKRSRIGQRAAQPALV